MRHQEIQHTNKDQIIMAKNRRRSDKLDDWGSFLIVIGFLGIAAGIFVAVMGETVGWTIAGTALALILTGHLFRGIAKKVCPRRPKAPSDPRPTRAEKEVGIIMT